MSLLLLYNIFASAAVPVVSFSAGNSSNLRVLNECFAGIRFNVAGDEKGSTNSGAFSVNRGTWLDVGDANDVWLRVIVTAGSTLNWFSDGVSARVNMGAVRSIGNRQPTAGQRESTVTIEAWDAASGGSLLDSVTGVLIKAVREDA